jgi:hypothetical protein
MDVMTFKEILYLILENCEVCIYDLFADSLAYDENAHAVEWLFKGRLKPL